MSRWPVRYTVAFCLCSLALCMCRPSVPGLIRPPPLQHPRALHLPGVTRLALDNGLRVLLVPDRSLPLTRVHLMVRTGTIDDPPGKAGLAELTFQMLRKGTARRGADQIAEATDVAGVKLNESVHYELAHLTCSGRSQHTDLCLELVAELVASPSFPEPEVAQVRRVLTAEARESRDDPATLAELHFDRLLFGVDHPLGRCTSEASLGRIGRQDLVRFHRRHVAPRTAMLAVSGDLGDTARLKARITALFSGWSARAAQRRQVKPVEHPPPGLKVLLVDKPGLTQSFFAIGHAGIRRTHPLRDAARVVNHVLSRLRLYKVVRARGGKTYSIRSRFDIATDDGSFIVKSFTRHDQLISALGLVQRELSRIRSQPPTASEVRQAKGRLAGGYPLRFATSSSLAATLMQAELFGLPQSYVTELGLRVQRLTSDEVRAATHLVRPRRLVLVIVSQASEVAPRLRRAGIAFSKISYLDPIDTWQGAAPEAVAISEQEQARARQILQRALVSAGGDLLRRIRRVSVEGRVQIVPDVNFASPPLRGTYALEIQPPDRLVLAMKLEAVGTSLKMSSKQELSGSKGTLESGGMRQPLPASRVARLRQALWRQPILVLRNAVAKGARSRTIQPEGLAADRIAVEVHASGQPATTLVLHRETFRLLQLRYRDARGKLRTSDLSDHRTVDGVVVPHKVVNRRGRRVQTLSIEKVTITATR